MTIRADRDWLVEKLEMTQGGLSDLMWCCGSVDRDYPSSEDQHMYSKTRDTTQRLNRSAPCGQFSDEQLSSYEALSATLP